MAGQIRNAERERIAGLLVSDLARQGLTLYYSPDSLVGLDRVLAHYGHGMDDGDRNMGLVEMAGSYFGEVLRGGLGSDWYEDLPRRYRLAGRPGFGWLDCVPRHGFEAVGTRKQTPGGAVSPNR